MPKPQQVAATIVGVLEEEGYKVRKTKTYLQNLQGWRDKPDYTASNPNRCVRVTICISSNRVSGQIKLQNNIGNYRLDGEFRFIPISAMPPGQYSPKTDLYQIMDGRTDKTKSCSFFNVSPDDFYRWFRTRRGQQAVDRIQSRADLAPLKFELSSVYLDGETTRIRHFYEHVECKSVCTITDKARVVDSGIEKPGEECWFRIDGVARSGQWAGIIVNHDCTRFHPIRTRRIKNQPVHFVSNNYTPNDVHDFRTMTVLDREAITQAIEVFIGSLHG